MPPSFTAFADELEKIGLEKRALPAALGKAGNWFKNQYSQLGVAAGQAMMGGRGPIDPRTGFAAPPIAGTIAHFVGNKLPAPTKPPGPLIQKVQRLAKSKPVQTIVPVLDQASEMFKLGGRAHPLPKKQKCAKCSAPAVVRIFWCEHRAYQPVCEKHKPAMVEHLKKQNFGEIDGIEKLAAVQPYQQKTQYSCSAACLKAVLEHWGQDRLAEHEIMYAIGVRDKGGAEVDQITEGAKALGFDAYDKCFSSLDEARSVTDQGIPIIADFQSFNNPGKGHYVVITEIGDDVVKLMDPNTDGNERVITRAECEQRWWDRTMAPPHKLMPKWGVVVTPKRSL